MANSDFSRRAVLRALSAGALAGVLPAGGALALGLDQAGFRQGLIEAVAGDQVLQAFYGARDYAAMWAGPDGVALARRNVLLAAMADAPHHGLPDAAFDAPALLARVQAASTPYAQGVAEAALSRAALDLGQALHGGFVTPSRVIGLIKRQPPQLDGAGFLNALAGPAPAQALRDVLPAAADYAGLMRGRAQLAQAQAAGGWGGDVTVGPAGKLQRGDTGAAVISLRDRLIRQGFMSPSLTDTFDADVLAGVQAFQAAHGLATDGVVGAGTLAELNTDIPTRLQQVLVAMERARWANVPLGARHIWVNLTDYHTVIRNNGAEEFRTRSVIGAVGRDRETPEFSDVMRFMVVNPSWNVPRSIVVGEYLPQMQRNPYAVNHIDLLDGAGRVVDRGAVNFNAYSASTFPFAMREPPSRGNALGLVKFMFPNQWNIYLHDTPSKSLFDRETRAFSHGCIRLADPFDFAYQLLAPQTSDPRGLFRRYLDTGRETRVDLAEPLPVHLDYRTAIVTDAGALQFRRDIYGRDAAIWRAMAQGGVAARLV
ncbi:Peptidoglycan binding domain protein, putative [Ketogulonicigenium robustum]|uniref:Peptidoglycan binding domain protein, putative n=1 Tax=Ketogulonicigenium robustum TaxID=92947 RepID=A0A1W6NY78_9RHOB|nr:L,D-transpeptidase family protein [Ketogulonicigenium robustum]ARO14192.1 Peptidoglycan binding domain protein, putative [Ketogulonicigenium robustum]